MFQSELQNYLYNLSSGILFLKLHTKFELDGVGNDRGFPGHGPILAIHGDLCREQMKHFQSLLCIHTKGRGDGSGGLPRYPGHADGGHVGVHILGLDMDVGASKLHHGHDLHSPAHSSPLTQVSNAAVYLSCVVYQTCLSRDSELYTRTSGT